MDMKEGWEKKALIGLGVVVVIIVLYAYFAPYNGTADNTSQPQVTSTGTVTPVTFVSPSNNNNTTNSSLNGNFTITAAQAQQIAQNANGGFTSSTPTQANINFNGTQHSVWIVPLSNGTASKTVYVDASNGNILPV
ncbi:MAG: peptidase [Methanobacterium sp.]|nr:peptidase [Methanobacterium sp.]